MKKEKQTDCRILVITLENAIYMGMKNDLDTFIIDHRVISLYEHQFNDYNPLICHCVIYSIFLT